MKNRHNRRQQPTGIDLLHDPALNKGMGFTLEERERYELRGLLPPRVSTLEEQVARVLENFRRKPNDLERFIFMNALRERSQRLFFSTVIEHLELMLPIIYTPTVGLACQTYSHLFSRAHGLFVTADDRGEIAKVLANWPVDDVRIIVVTDGERILGLGDQGAGGMGIPIGKLSLYTACAGIEPTQCLPVTLDVGTNNSSLLQDPLYVGVRRPRLSGPEYDTLFEEFLEAVVERFPDAVIQLEDFATANAFRLLNAYRERAPLFDDDIQGTAAVTLAGIYSALRITGGAIRDQRLLMLGAGEAGAGIAELVVRAMIDDGATESEARQNCWLFDTHGLVVEGRGWLADHKRGFAHRHAQIDDLVAAIDTLRPTALIGSSGQPAMFTEPVVRAMATINERPIVFALSNPTSKAECTAEQAYNWSRGRAVYASGSPFDPVGYEGRTLVPGQCNNAYIFPGVGFGAIACSAVRITDEMFLAAARALAACVTEEDLAAGRIFPSLQRIRDVSLDIAEAVAQIAHDEGLSSAARPRDIRAALGECVYDPRY